MKNAVKMFKDIGVSVHHLWYKSMCSRLSFCLDLICLSHLCVGLTLRESSFCRIGSCRHFWDWEEEGHVEGEALRTDWFACSKIVLVFLFILNEGVHVFQDSTAVLVGMLIMPYDFQLFSCVFTSIAKSILSYPLSSQITWGMSSMEVLVVFVRNFSVTLF